MFNKRTFRPKDTISIAGWLFADLLLGLSMFFLVSNSIGFDSTSTITPTHTLTPTLTSTITPSFTPKLTQTSTPTLTQTITPTTTSTFSSISQGLELEPISCDFRIDFHSLLADDEPSEGVKRVVKQHLERCYAGNSDRVAGFVLTIGYHRDIVGLGYPIAARINSIIREVSPEMFGRVRFEAFGGHRTDTPDGYVWIRAYFVTGINRLDNR